MELDQMLPAMVASEEIWVHMPSGNQMTDNDARDERMTSERLMGRMLAIEKGEN